MEFSPVAADKNIGIAKLNNHNGQLLDREKLDSYLLSLLSSDLFDTLYYALVVKGTIWESIAVARNKQPGNCNSEQPTIQRLEESSQTGQSGIKWLRWKDLLAVLTIWASHGQTPGARALGFDIFDAANTSQTGAQNSRLSFWWWITGSTCNNVGRAALIRYKILLYAFLRSVLPRLYEHIKSKGFEYANSPTIGIEEGDSEREAKEQPNIRILALQRRKLFIRTILQWMDRAILPSVKLTMLLLCWAGIDSGHGGDLALWMSGLSYRPTTTQGTKQAATSTATIATIPIFVLYAHRRWLHREAVELLWNKFGRSIILMQRETTELGSAVAISLATKWKMLMVRLRYKLNELPRNILPNANPSGNDLQNSHGAIDGEAEPCSICGIHKVVVPYRLTGCCGKVACYVCLWESLASTATLDKKCGAKVPCPVCYQNISKCDPV